MPFASIVNDLYRQGWSLTSGVFPQATLQQLEQECRARQRCGSLQPAGIGRGAQVEVNENIRGDRIEWLELGQSPSCDQYLQHMDKFRQALNQAFFLGLDDFESHFALYPKGAFYRTHLDRFRDSDRRTVSSVLYLNPNWTDGDGGCLRLHLPEGNKDIAPRQGDWVVFLSGEIPHEVLETHTERLSLTGWFLRRAS